MPKLNRIRPTHSLALLVVAVGLLASACSSSGSPSDKTVTKTGSGPAAPASSDGGSTSSSASATPTKPAETPVSLKTIISDGATYGVGMPVIVYFSKKPTSAKDFQAQTKVTVNGKPLNAAWYFEYSSANKGYPVEGHLRPQAYWPAHSKVHVQFPASGTTLGKGLAVSSKLTSLDFSIGARHVTTVDDAAHTVTVTSDGKKYGTFPTSLGASNTPTKRGVKVIMEKGRDISMRGPGYYDPSVKFTQRLTYSGEYLHSAPWNVSNINNGVDSSNGCTNLLPKDAEQLYGYLKVGDVVTFPNAKGPQMQLGQGYGDWNVSWSEWQTGGLVSTTA